MSHNIAEKMELLRRMKESKNNQNSSPTPPQDNGKPQPQPVIKVVNTAYDDVANVTVGKRASLKWDDSKLSEVPCYNVTQMSAGQIIALGTKLISNIRENTINSSTVDICLTLAVSIPKPASSSFEHMLVSPASTFGKSMSFEQPSSAAGASAGLSAASARLLVKTKEKAEAETDEAKKAELERVISKLEAQETGKAGSSSSAMADESEAAAYCFIAAVLLKLYAKTPETFVAGLQTMRDRFSAWYDCPKSILKEFNPTEAAITSLRVSMSRRPEILSTWVLWVAYNENKEEKLLMTHQGLLTYLACQQFSYPGMHAYTLLIDIHEQTGMNFGYLLREMDCPATRSGVKEIFDLIKDYEVTKANPKRSTYFRYARNWDPKYFGTLQSSQCKTLVYVAASVNKKISAQGVSGDPMEIFAIKAMDVTMRTRLDAVADKMAHKIIDQMLFDANSGEAWSA